MKICIVSSCGGHLTEVRCLKKIYEKYEIFYVINQKIILPKDMLKNTYFITHSERDLRFFKNLFEIYKLFKSLSPDLILTTGAGPAVPAALVGRLFNKKIIFIETITRITKPSLTGFFMKYLANEVFYQWPQLSKYFPNGKYIGTLV